jgi:hypothetical protein
MNNFEQTSHQRLSNAQRKAIYTFSFGDYDDLKSPTFITPGWDYICFTDDPTLRSDVWDVRWSPRGLADHQLEQKKYAMKHMILFHRYLPGYDLSLSIGAQVVVSCDLDELMWEHFQPSDDMMICRHDARNCVYDEARVCQTWLLDDPARIEAQMDQYRARGYPSGNGLFATGIIARWHDRDNLRAMCEFWWEEYQRGSRRDQLSLNYSIWNSAPIKISVIDFAQQFGPQRNFNVCPHKWRIRFDGTNIKLRTSDANLVAHGGPVTPLHPNYAGYIDTADCYAIRGWAADRDRLNVSISISLYDGDTLISTAPADLPRPDANAFLGDRAPHGFAIAIPDRLKNELEHSLSIRFEMSNIEVAFNPVHQRNQIPLACCP